MVVLVRSGCNRHTSNTFTPPSTSTLTFLPPSPSHSSTTFCIKSTSLTSTDTPEDRCKVRMDRGRERDIEDTEERGGREGEGEDKGGHDDIGGFI